MSGRPSPPRGDRRGQSEVLGFVLVFALITASVATVYAVGFAGLQDARTSAQTDNVERAFDVLADNVEDVYRRDAPSRATEVRTRGGRIELDDRVRVKLEVTNTSEANDNATYDMATLPITYRHEETTISYVGGALVRSDDGYARMISEPHWAVDDERAIVPFVVALKGGNRTSIGGDTRTLVVTEQRSRRMVGEFRTGPNSTAEVNVTVESPRAAAWKQYFEDRGFQAVDADPDDGEITYQFETDAVYVPRTTIGVSLET